MAEQTPAKKRKYYQSTPQDKKWALAIGVFYVILAIGLGYMLFKIWPPVPWPEPEKHPKLIAKALEECASPTPTPSPSPVAAAGVQSASPPGATTSTQPTTTAQPTTTTTTTLQQNTTTTTAPGGATPKEAATPKPEATPKEPIAMPISFFFKKCVMTTFDERLLLLVIVAGILGSFIHGATSLADYVGNNSFSRRWTWFYVLRPVIGMALALVFYFVVRGGFLTTNVGATDINPYGIAALAGLVGMFSKQATDKLSEVFTTLFRSGEGDDKRADPLDPNSAPDALKADPPDVVAGGESFKLTVTGTDFVDGCKILLDEAEQTTTFESATSLSAQVAKETIAAPRVFKLTVLKDATKYPPIDFEVKAPENGGNSNTATATVTDLNPKSVPAASPNLTLTITGTNFADGDTVHVNDAPQSTTFVSATQLTAEIDPALLATAGILKVKVVNQEGASSPETDFTVT